MSALYLLDFQRALNESSFRQRMSPSSSSSSAAGPYTSRDIRSLYPSITDNHLRFLEKWALVRVGSAAGERVYSFSDLLTVKRVAAEIESGTPLRVILRTLTAERQGQLELDFQPGHAGGDTPRAKVVSLSARKERSGASMTAGISPGPSASCDASLAGYVGTDPQRALAAKYFAEGSRLDDGDGRKMEEAASAYRKALVVDPDLVPAIVNLANIHYARDELIEAHALYERAIALDAECFEAHFNLGNIHHDLGRYSRALVCYRAAVVLNPEYPDAHFYLAVTLEKTGQSGEAKPHWRSYQSLAPNGEWAELASEFSE
jgi:tetratricopeptide (TPR) repeat protein